MTRRLLLLLLTCLGAVGPATALAAARANPAHARQHVANPSHAPRRPAVTGSLVIRGGGYGHGVGLSQWGALGLAEHGADYRAILAHYYLGTGLGVVDPTATVRVLLGTGSAAFSGVASVGSTKLDPGLTYGVKALADGTLEIVGPSHQPVGPRWQAPLGVAGPAGTVSLAGGGLYRGGLEFRPDGSGGVQTVDVVGLDDYVRGVVSHESPSSWPAAALEAQAVAARTYALTTSVSGNGYTLYPDTRSQMYGGVAAETPSTDAAVAATRGQVVTYGGHMVVTYFGASSGGYTASVQDVWRGASPEPWLHAVPDPYDAAGGNPYHLWTYTFNLGQAAAKLGSLLKGDFRGIRILQRGDSPRVLTAEVLGTRGTTTVSGAELQQKFGLPTTLATFTTIIEQPASHGPASGGAAIVHDRWEPSRLAAQTLAALAPAARLVLAPAARLVLAPAAQLALAPAAQLALAPAVHALAGTVTPAPTGDRVAVETLSGRSWRRVGTVRVGRGGAVNSTVGGAGTYRFRWRQIAGPALRVS